MPTSGSRRQRVPTTCRESTLGDDTHVIGEPRTPGCRPCYAKSDATCLTTVADALAARGQSLPPADAIPAWMLPGSLEALVEVLSELGLALAYHHHLTETETYRRLRRAIVDDGLLLPPPGMRVQLELVDRADPGALSRWLGSLIGRTEPRRRS